MGVLKNWMTASVDVPAGHRIVDDYQSGAAGGVVDRKTAEQMVPPALTDLIGDYNKIYAGTVEITHATLRADGSLEDIWLVNKGDKASHPVSTSVMRNVQASPNGFTVDTYFGGTQHFTVDEAGKLSGNGWTKEQGDTPYLHTRETFASDGRDPKYYGSADHRFKDKAAWGMTHSMRTTRIDWPARTEQRLTLIGKALVGFGAVNDPTKPASPKFKLRAPAAKA